MELKVADLPSERELHALQLEISELRGELREVRPELLQLESACRICCWKTNSRRKHEHDRYSMLTAVW